MISKQKFSSITLVSAAMILFFILISSMALAASSENKSLNSNETRITTIDATQAYKDGNEKNGTESSSDTITTVQPHNILESMTAGTEKMNRDTEVTIYDQNLALVKEKREFNLTSGVSTIEYTNVASQIDPTSILVEDPINNKTAVLEQQYGYDLVSSSNLLDKYLEKKITVTDRIGKNYNGKLLSHDGKDVVLKRDDGSVVSLDTINVKFPDTLGLLTKPTLVWQIYSPTSGKRDLSISYLTGGLSWNVNYIIQANAASTKADIRSWASINNNAGITFDDAKLKLVAGDTHSVYGLESMYIHRGVGARGGSASAKDVSEPLFEYHLYTLEKPVTLLNHQAKQISLISVDSVPVQKEFVFDSWKSKKVQVVLNMENSEVKGLGNPLPKGTVRVYQQDFEEKLQFLGEDQIANTPKGDKIKINVGSAFDIIGKRTQTDYEKIDDSVDQTSYEIKLNNSKSEAQNVTVVEHFYGDWKIIKSSDKYEKTDASTVEFRVSIPANGTKSISYVVENKV
jgi:hypothetical protein